MFDKILLITLILLLPLGIVATKLLSTNTTLTGGNQISIEREKKIDQLLTNLQNKAAISDTGASPIEITGVVYATQSSIITVGGTLPSGKLPLEITVLAKSNNKSDLSKPASGSAEKHLPIQQQFGVIPTSQSFATDINLKDYYGNTFIIFRQGQSETTVGYDLSSNKRITL